MIRITVPIEAVAPHPTLTPPPVPVFIVRYLNAGLLRAKLLRGDVPGASDLRTGARATLHIEGGEIVRVGDVVPARRAA